MILLCKHCFLEWSTRIDSFNKSFEFIQSYIKILFPQINLIHSAMIKLFVEFIFQRNCIFGKNKTMDIKREKYRGIA